MDNIGFASATKLQTTSLTSSKEQSKLKYLDIVKKTYQCVCETGIEALQLLCENKLLNVSETELKNSVDESVDIGWFLSLSNDEVKTVQTHLTAFAARSEDILAALRSDQTREATVEVFQHQSFNIDAQNGDINFVDRSANEGHREPIQLLSARQFLELNREKLSGLRLQSIYLDHANLDHAILDNSDMRKAHLQEAVLYDASMKGVDLRNTFLIKTNLGMSNLCGAKLSEAQLLHTNIIGAQFDKETNLNKAFIHMELPDEWNQNSLENYFTPIPNANYIGLLTTIDSINDNDKDKGGKIQKVNMMLQVIESLKGTDIDNVKGAFEDILNQNPVYLKNEKIKEFAKERKLNVK